MPNLPQTLHRPRFFHRCWHSGAVPTRRHIAEYVISLINVCVQLAFLVGSFCFFSEDEVMTELGDMIFIVGSLITFVIAMLQIWETTHQTHYNALYASVGARRARRYELGENVLFMASALIFAVGSVFYWPNIFENGHLLESRTKTEVEVFAVNCFILGSIGFFFAACCNALLEASHGRYGSESAMQHLAHALGLVCAQFGGACFIVGSVLYRPAFRTTCSYNSDSALHRACDILKQKGRTGDVTIDKLISGNRSEGETLSINMCELKAACENTSWFGTWAYVVGSACYLVGAAISFLVAIVSREFIIDESEYSDELSADDDYAYGEDLKD